MINGVFQVVGETSRHPLIAKCVSMITESAFDPEAIARVRTHANKFIVSTRKEYSMALRQNLQGLLDGAVAPRHFVKEFFELTEAGNMRSDIRKKLVISLLLSENIRPSIKFLFLENFDRLPAPVQAGIVGEVMKAEPSRHMDILKEELSWIVSSEKEGINAMGIDLGANTTPAESRVKEDRPHAVSDVIRSDTRKRAKAQPRPWRPGEKTITMAPPLEIPWN